MLILWSPDVPCVLTVWSAVKKHLFLVYRVRCASNGRQKQTQRVKTVKIGYFRAKWAYWDHFGSMPIHDPWSVHRDQRARAEPRGAARLVGPHALHRDRGWATWQRAIGWRADPVDPACCTPCAPRRAPRCHMARCDWLASTTLRAQGVRSAGVVHVAASGGFRR